MSAPITGTIHHIPFYSSTTVLLSNFTIVAFTVNGAPVSSTVNSSLTLVSVGGGIYQFQYTPDIAGYYLFAAIDVAKSLYITDGIDIDNAPSYVSLTQTSPVNLVPTVANPQNYLLMLFLSSDWLVGRTDPLYAVASTQLDSSGNWLTTPLIIQHNTYHVVVEANDGTTVVISAFLTV